MGVSAADYDLDGNLDIVKTNFAGDTPSLYHNQGAANYNPGCKRGIRVGSVKDGKVQYYIPPPPGVHVDENGTVAAGATAGAKTCARARPAPDRANDLW